MPKFKRNTVTEQSVDHLRNQILNNDLQPGAAITEGAMAQELGISRPTTREVLNTLTGEGLLTRDSRTRVLKVTTLNRDEVREIYTARRVLELAGVEAAAERPDDELLQLSIAVGEMATAVKENDLPGIVAADTRTHSLTVSFLHTRYLSASHAQLMAKLQLVFSRVESSADRDAQMLLRTHQTYAHLILNRHTEEAATHLRARLHEAEELVLSVLAPREPPEAL